MRQLVLKYFPSDVQPVALLARLSILALLFALEILLIPYLEGRDYLAVQTRYWGPAVVKGAIAYAAVFTAFGAIKYRTALLPISAELSASPLSRVFLVTHFVAIAMFIGISSVFDGGGPVSSQVPYPVFFGTVWLGLALTSILSAGFALIPPALWLRIVRATPFLWLWAAIAALAAYFVGTAMQSLWVFATNTTFRLSQALLRPLLPDLVVDPLNLLIGTGRFMLQVAPGCSGLEGIGLILVFGISCLAAFRDQFRFPHALLLLPGAAVIVFLLNSVRIAALVLIGNAGAKQIAMRGFHSQAGWMIFCLVALGLSLSARKIPWLSATGSASALPSQFENPTTRWLFPFLTLLAAGMISVAGAGSFEWLYPVRFFAVLFALIFLWRRYSDLDLSVSWWAPAMGLVVFLVWIGLDRFGPGAERTPSPLLATDPLSRTVWLIFRVLAATITVPIAEELAFRGFLYRRVLSPDFENVSLRHFSWIAMLIASLAFGLLHGDRWFVGFLAGALYTLLLVRRGSMGDAVAAHATTNALLAVDVLAFHRWHLW